MKLYILCLKMSMNRIPCPTTTIIGKSPPVIQIKKKIKKDDRMVDIQAVLAVGERRGSNFLK
jgi:hypothetical protein